MKMKIMFVNGSVILLCGMIIASSSNPLYSISMPTCQNPINKSKLNQNNKIIVFGNCYGISVNGDIKQGEGRNKHMVGRITGNLSIRNEPPLPPRLLGDLVPYVLTIIYPNIGAIYIKTLLPLFCYLSNFTGFGYINDYYKSWGPTRGIFFLYGFVN